jgi:hypothetical protein
MKLKSHHFDTIAVIKPESQVVLNTLTQHDFQDAFTKRQKCREQYVCTEGDYFKCDGGQ